MKTRKIIMAALAVLMLSGPAQAVTNSEALICMAISVKAKIAIESYVSGDMAMGVGLYMHATEDERAVIRAIFTDKFGTKDVLSQESYRNSLKEIIHETCLEKIHGIASDEEKDI